MGWRRRPWAPSRPAPRTATGSPYLPNGTPAHDNALQGLSASVQFDWTADTPEPPTTTAPPVTTTAPTTTGGGETFDPSAGGSKGAPKLTLKLPKTQTDTSKVSFTAICDRPARSPSAAPSRSRVTPRSTNWSVAKPPAARRPRDGPPSVPKAARTATAKAVGAAARDAEADDDRALRRRRLDVAPDDRHREVGPSSAHEPLALVDSLLDTFEPGASSPGAERILTEGYAHALRLENQLRRLEREMAPLAAHAHEPQAARRLSRLAPRVRARPRRARRAAGRPRRRSKTPSPASPSRRGGSAPHRPQPGFGSPPRAPSGCWRCGA